VREIAALPPRSAVSPAPVLYLVFPRLQIPRYLEHRAPKARCLWEKKLKKRKKKKKMSVRGI